MLGSYYKIRYCIFLLGILPLSLLGQGQSTYLFGTVTNPIQKDISFHFSKDNISYQEVQFDISLNDANRFGTQFELSKPLPARLIYKNTEIPLLLFPGDSLKITFDALNPAQNINFSGPGALQNQWFFESALAFREFPEEVINEEIISRGAFSFEIYLERVHQQKVRFFNQWRQQKKIPKAVEGYILADMEYWRAYQMMRYPFVKTATEGTEAMVKLPYNYFQYLNRILLNNADMLYSVNYLNFLDRVNQYWTEVPSLQKTIQSNLKEIAVEAPQMLLLAAPDRPPVLDDLTKGEVVLDMEERSEVRSKIQIDGKFLEGNWIKVKSSRGEIGYVNEVGMVKDNKGEVLRLNDLLKGQVKAYQSTKNFYWNKDRSEAQLREQLASVPNSEEYLSILLEEDKKGFTAIESFHLRNPRILVSDEVNLLFGEEPVIVEAPVAIATRSEKDLERIALPDIGRENDPEPETQDAILAGKIRGLGKKEAAVSYLIDLLQMKDEKRIIKVNSDGSFNIKIPLRSAQLTTFSIGNQSLKVILSPGETSRLVTQAGALNTQTKFSATNAAANTFLISMEVYIDQKEPYYNRIIKETDGAGFKAMVKSYCDEWKSSLASSSAIKNTGRQLIQSEIDYWFGNQLLNFPWEQPLRLGRDAPLTMDDNYYSFIDELSLAGDENMWNPTFLNYLDQTLDYLKRDKGYNIQTIADTRLSGETYWWALGQGIARGLRRGDLVGQIEALENYLEQCPYPSFRNRLRELYNDNRGLGSGDPAPAISLTDVLGNPVNLAAYAGSVVYLDFWATWCTPCLTQMRNSRQWKNKFYNEKVVFLYVSLDQDPAKWRNYLSNHQVAGTHAHAGTSKVFGTEIAKQYGVKKLPAVFIIGKDGTIEYASPQEGGGVVTAEIIQSLLQ